MAIAPATYNIELQRRASYYVDLQFKDSNNAVIDLTYWTAYGQVWNIDRTTKYADFTITYTDRLNGKIKLSLTDTQTTSFPNTAYYDVLLEDSTGIKEYYLQGKVLVSEGYSA